jgi:hypothetical protein
VLRDRNKFSHDREKQINYFEVNYFSWHVALEAEEGERAVKNYDSAKNRTKAKIM